MKKFLSTFLATLALGSMLYAAPSKSAKTGSSTSKFAKGTFVNGTTATGSARRWFFFNEGSIGSSYSWLGRSQYVSVDLGYSAYLRSIESVLGGMNFMIGTEISAPIFIRPIVGSRSNILNDHRFLESSEFDGVAGGGLQLPIMMGFEYHGFYFMGFAGYTWLWMNDTYQSTTVGAHPTVSFMGFAGYTWLWMNDTYQSTTVGAHPTVRNMYDGVVYGGGIGYKVSNIVNIGIRYTGGSLTNRIEQLDPDAVLANDTIGHTTGRSVYDIPYHKISIFVSLIY